MEDESRNWPIRPDGHMLIEYHSEDGEWSGYAESGTNGGNLRWEMEAVPIRVMKPGDVVLSKQEIELVRKGLVVLANRKRSPLHHAFSESVARETLAFLDLKISGHDAPIPPASNPGPRTD